MRPATSVRSVFFFINVAPCSMTSLARKYFKKISKRLSKKSETRFSISSLLSLLLLLPMMMCCCCFFFFLFLRVVVAAVCLYVLFSPFAKLVLFRFRAWVSISLTCSIYIHVIFFFCTLVLGSTNIFYYMSIPVKLSVISLFT